MQQRLHYLRMPTATWADDKMCVSCFNPSRRALQGYFFGLSNIRNEY
jgi:hypothetical protein